MKQYIFLFVVTSLLVPIGVSAATATVFIDTGSEAVNALEGAVVLSGDAHEIHTGNSAILFWMIPPAVASDLRTISFAGVTPGGFQGEHILFTINGDFSADVSFTSQEIVALSGDGSGRAVPVELSIRLTSALEDTAPPESFAPTVARESSVLDGKWFIAFATQDKGSGIARYSVKEYKFKLFSFLSPWREAESPFILRDQSLRSHIAVKAFDNATNVRVEVISPTKPLSWYHYASFWIIIIAGGVLGVFFYRKWKI